MRFADESGRSASENGFAVDDGEQADSKPPPQSKSCTCSQDTNTLVKAIGDLGRQLSDMSSALVDKISAVENRLGRMENQIRDVQAAVEEQHEFAWKSNAAHFTRTTGDPSTPSDDELPKASDLADRRRTLDVEPPCAWPPQPSVFERY